MDSDQVENKKQIDSLIQQEFKDKILTSMKENLIFSLISFIFAKITDLDSDIDKKSFQKDFINFWKKNINETTQAQLSAINGILNENNIDMLNIITGSANIADVEDYQEIINETIKEVEGIFWKICGEDIK